MNKQDAIKKFVLGFLNPGLFGVYVLISVLSATVFGVYYFGYGCWFRTPLLFLFFILVAILLSAVVLTGWLQIRIWLRLQKQSDLNSSQTPLTELLWRSCLVALMVPFLFAYIGGGFREARVRKACADCTPLFANLQKEKQLTGIYPTNTVALVKSNAVLRRRYFFYYGHSGTNGVDWSPDEISKANTISLFVTTNYFQCVIPIEQMSPISFSSYYVFSYSSEHPAWNKALLHWSLLGAYIDKPK